MNRHSSVSAFTMIEIVITISLIGLFIAIPIFAYSNYLKSSRDLRRKNDINQIQAALEQYKSRTGQYPAGDNLQILQSMNLLPNIPQDPLHGQPIPGEAVLTYDYVYTPTESLNDYELLARLEAQNNSFYRGTPLGNTVVHTDPGTGLPATNTPMPHNTLVPSLSAIPTSSNTPTITPTPSTIFWSSIATANGPSARSNMAYAWTGTKMFIFGGSNDSGNLHDGFMYNGVSNSWAPVSATNAPANTNTTDFRAVWTGTKIVVWGDRYSTEGGIYDPTTDTWIVGGTESTNAPTARYNHTAIWTGSRVIIWGGNDQNNGALNDGAMFDPSVGRGTWTPLSASPLAVRTGYSAVWADPNMIIWGGVYGTYYNDGAAYNPSTDKWTAISIVNAPSPRTQHVAVWTGHVMIIWGGRDENGNALKDGAMYDPVLDKWTAMDTTNAPVGASLSTALVYNGKLYVWGGNQGSLTMTNEGGIFDPGIGTNGKWTPISTNGAPAGRMLHAFTTNGSKLFVWGGFGNSGILGDGGVYILH
jgi:type II secretory pathway pseudopilin PulG